MPATPADTPALNDGDGLMVLWSITAAQKSFLAGRLPDYRSALGKVPMNDFWDPFLEEWFTQWPTEGAQAKLYIEEQLKSWMVTNNRWHINASQRKFLQEWTAQYKVAQGKKRLADFWPVIFLNWFQRWPPTEVAPQGLVEKKLKAWFNNNARVTTNARQVLNLNQPAKRIRRPAEFQTFCNVYWSQPLPDGTVLRDTIATEWIAKWKASESYNAETKLPRVPVDFINLVASRIYDGLNNAAIKQEIRNHPDQQKRDDTLSDGDDEGEPTVQAQAYQKAIDALPYSLDQAGIQILKQSGLISFTMVAGPVPSQAGNIGVFSFSEGALSSGYKFTHFCPNAVLEFEQKFGEFAKMVFAPAERAKRALPGTEDLRNYETNAPSSAPATPSVPLAPAKALSKKKPSAVASTSEVVNEEDDSDSDVEVVTPSVATSTPRISEYERIREENIARNQALLVELGLDKPMFDTPAPKTRAPRKTKSGGQAAARRSTRLSTAQPTDKGKNPSVITLSDDSAKSSTPEPLERAEASVSVVPPDEETIEAATVPGPTETASIPNAERQLSNPPNTTASGNEPALDGPVVVDVEAGTTNASGETDTGASPSRGIEADADDDAIGDTDSECANATANATPHTDPRGDANIDTNVDPDNDSAADPGSNADANSNTEAEANIPGAPKWLRRAIACLTKRSPNAHWDAVVKNFIRFEQSLGFLDGKIPSQMLASGKHRPKEISLWVKSGRATEPSIKSAATFGQQWVQWYTELQPTGRKSDDGTLEFAVPNGEPWTELSKGTINGFYSIVASLGWWLRATEVNNEANKEVIKAMKDVAWVLEVMATAASAKRATPDTAVEGRSPKRPRIA